MPSYFPIEQLEYLKSPPITDLDNKRAMCIDSICCFLLVSQQGANAFSPLLLSALPRKHQERFV